VARFFPEPFHHLLFAPEALPLPDQQPSDHPVTSQDKHLAQEQVRNFVALRRELLNLRAALGDPQRRHLLTVELIDAIGEFRALHRLDHPTGPQLFRLRDLLAAVGRASRQGEDDAGPEEARREVQRQALEELNALLARWDRYL
jgi:hypothetical protein